MIQLWLCVLIYMMLRENDMILKRFWYIFVVSLSVMLSPMYCHQSFADEEDYIEDDLEEPTEVFASGTNESIGYADSDDESQDVVMDVPASTLNSGAELVNVADFDIAGIMLGMPFEDVYNIYHDKTALYTLRRRNGLVYTIPQDWKYNLDYECRQRGILQPEKLESCIRGLARNRGLLYVSEIHLERVKTGETIDVYLTSNATDNVVYRVVYNNDADETEGVDNPDGKYRRFADQREKKLLAFWKHVVQKYGTPNAGQDTWLASTNAYDPKMIAYYGSLDLVDESRHAMDVAQAAKQSSENFRAKPYAF